MSEAPPRLLVVDDEEFNRDLLRRRLERNGFRVDAVDSGEAALLALDQTAYDLVMLDIQMPGMSGLEVLDAIRRRHPVPALPVIMTTALADSETTVAALERGASDYVTKPIDMAVAVARIRTALRGRKAAPAAAPRADLDGETRSDDWLVGRSDDTGAGRMRMPEDLVGHDLAGKYRVERLIGRGGFAAVYEATHLGLRTAVAIKVLLVSLRSGPEHLQRFQREAISTCRIHHPNAVQVFDCDVTAAGLPFLVMELLQGRSLDAELAQGPLSPRRVGEILVPVCDVLIEAHSAGIIHRDLKPANIFLHRHPQGETVKVVDFGLAKMVEGAGEDAEEPLTREGQLLGTPGYMPPERFRGQAYDSRADTYSLGVMLYRMLAGTLPFHGSGDLLQIAMRHISEVPAPLRARRPEVSKKVESLVLAALAKTAAERPSLRHLAREFAAEVGVAIDPALHRHLR